MRHHRSIAATLATVPAFAAAAVLSRYNLRTTETRLQIAAFIFFAAAGELSAWLTSRDRSSAIRFILNATTATIVLVVVQNYLESDARQHDTAVFRQLLGSMVETVHETSSTS